VVFQDPTLFPWRTVWDNVALGLEAQGILKSQRHRVDAAIDLVGLSTFRNAYPHQLSGGMAQRVALARALVNDPRILILDEPLGKLDSLTRITMQAEIASLWQRSGFTTLLVTHDVEEAVFLANRVIVFSDRPARIKATSRSIVPIPGTGAIPNWRNCAGIFWGCLDWTPHGERAGQFHSQRTSQGRKLQPSSTMQTCLLPNLPRAPRCMIVRRVFRSRISTAVRDGLLALTVPTALGGSGAGALDAARIITSWERPIHRRRWCCRCIIFSIW